MSKLLIFTAAALAVAPVVAMAGLGLTRKGYESPDYEVVKKEDGFEIRDYAGMQLVSTDMSKDEGDKGFMRLFRYIDKGNADEEKIAMTTPVFIEGSRSEGTMSFVVPKEVAADGAPAPTGEKVRLEKTEPMRMAVMRFKGSRSDEKARAAEQSLREKLAAAGYEAVAGAPTFLAYYDPPWTPEGMRRNEVLVPVKVTEIEKDEAEKEGAE